MASRTCGGRTVLAWARPFAAAVGLLLLPLSHQAPAGELRKVTEVWGISEYRLENGLKVLLAPQPFRPTFTLALTYFAGSRHEKENEAGLAHFLEHVTYRGTKTYADLRKKLEDHDAPSGSATSADRTTYYEILPYKPENLAFALNLEAERMVNCRMDSSDLASELEVVRQEWEAAEIDPAAILDRRMAAQAYERHPYRNPVMIFPSDADHRLIDRLRAFYRRHYQPDNAMLVLSGNFDPDVALVLIQKFFGTLARPTRQLDTASGVEPVQEDERSVVIRRASDAGIAGILYHGVSGAHEDFAAQEALVYLLTAESSGRVHKEMVDKDYAEAVWGNAHARAEPGVIRFFARVREGRMPAALESARDRMIEAIEEFAAGPIRAEDLERYKSAAARELEATLQDDERTAIELSEWGAIGDWRLMMTHRDRIQKLTREQVRRVAWTYLVPGNRTVGLLVPVPRFARGPLPDTLDASLMEDDGVRHVRKVEPDTAPVEVMPAAPETGPVARQAQPDTVAVAAPAPETVARSVSPPIAAAVTRIPILPDTAAVAVTLPETVAPAETRLSDTAAVIMTPRDTPADVKVPPTPPTPPPRAQLVPLQGGGVDTIESIERRCVRTVLKNGARVAFVPGRTPKGTVKFILALHTGGETDFSGSGRAASLVPGMLPRGSKKHTSQKIRNLFDRYKARVVFEAGVVPGEVIIRGETLREHLPAVMELIAELLQKPAFPPKEFAIHKKEKLAAIEAKRHDPNQLGRRGLIRKTAPWPKKDVHYVPTFEEEMASVREAKLSDVTKFHKNRWNTLSMELTVMGDVDIARTRSLLEKSFGAWRAIRPHRRMETPYRAAGLAWEMFLTPDKRTAVVGVAGAMEVRDEDTDYAALEIINHVLHSGDRSRLTRRLRKTEGLAHGAFSHLEADPADRRGHYLAGVICPAGNAERVRRVMKEVIERLVLHGIGADDLAAAKKTYRRAFDHRLANDDFVLAAVNKGLYDNRTLEYYNALNARIQALTPMRVHAVIRKYLRQDQPAKPVTVKK